MTADLYLIPTYSLRTRGAAQREVAQIAVRKLGKSAAEVARRLGVRRACTSRIVAKGRMSQIAEEIAVEWAA